MNLQIISSQISIFSIVLLLVVFFANRGRGSCRLLSSTLYQWMIWSVIIILASDILSIFADGKSGIFFNHMHIFSITIYYFFHILIMVLWTLYVYYTINESSEKFKKIIMIFSPIMAVVLIVLIFNINRDIIYYIDENNVYHRGKYLSIIPAISYLIMFYTFIVVFVNKSNISPRDYKALLFYPVLPAIASIFQLAFLGLSLIWPFMSLSVLVIYIFIQSRISTSDYLTGLSNRREVENFLNKKFSNHRGRTYLGGILIDINNFKSINDEFYHYTGDIALIEFANLLKRSADKNDFVARIGGDEFLILCESTSKKRLKEIAFNLVEELELFNSKGKHEFKLDISYGLTHYDRKKHESIKDFFKELDVNMYEMKKSK